MLVLKSFKLVNYAYFNSYTKYIQAHRFTYKGYCMDVYGLVQFAFPKKKSPQLIISVASHFIHAMSIFAGHLQVNKEEIKEW